MQIAENWSRICGRVEAWQPPRKAGDHGTLTIAVDRVEDVVSPDGSRHRNLLAAAAGSTVEVIVPASAAEGLEPQAGETAIIDVRSGRAPGRVFAHPARITLAP